MAQHEVNKSLFSPTTTNPLNNTLLDSSYHQQWPGAITHTPRVPPNGLQLRLVLPTWMASAGKPFATFAGCKEAFADLIRYSENTDTGDWYYKPLTAEILYDVYDGICNLDHIFRNLLLKVTASSPEHPHTHRRQTSHREHHPHQMLSVTMVVEAGVGMHVNSDDDTGVEMLSPFHYDYAAWIDLSFNAIEGKGLNQTSVESACNMTDTSFYQAFMTQEAKNSAPKSWVHEKHPFTNVFRQITQIYNIIYL
ncbi:hypothetical protein B0H14DRAFT_2634345 [Mycena olivaceomarginata]|nr:hypothetical protein B0H14DRAFT_2634345 [Mycena olivaceomarginata]